MFATHLYDKKKLMLLDISEKRWESECIIYEGENGDNAPLCISSYRNEMRK